MAPFNTLFCVSLLINVVTTFRSSSYFPKYKHFFGFSRDSGTSSNESTVETKSNSNDDAKHGDIMKKYLAVYLLAVLSDWLQGPYVYALYDAYGYSQHDIAVLFVAGFGSSMIFGTFIGGLADSCGRKKFTIIFALVYALSCITKHFNDFGILMIGRLLGGIATSLLFSVFDSWLIRSHSEAGVSSYLSKSFAAAQYGNSIIAILAGLLANKVASLGEMKPFHDGVTDGALLYKDGFLLPFDFALGALCICGTLAFFLWEENYGDNKDSSNEDENDDAKPKHWYDAFTSAYLTTVRSKEILYAGLICSLFEGSMFIFVFMWTPAMKALSTGDLPFGLIFATFMVCCMAGSSIFSIIIPSVKVEKLGIYVLISATTAFTLMAMASTDTTIMIAFLMFEVCVGSYFPMMGTMKSVIVPESKRAAIYNLYRIPLNFIVLFSLLTDFTPKQSFLLCIGMLITATLLMSKLVSHQQTYISSSTADPSDLELGEKEKLVSPSNESDASQENSEKES